MAKWYGFSNFKERNACDEAKVVGTCCYVNENNDSPPKAVRQYWDGSWIGLAGPIASVYPPNVDPVPPVGNSFTLPDRVVRHKAGKSGAGSDNKGPYGLMNNVVLPFEAKEMWLVMNIMFPENFDWDHSKSSGKIYGLSSYGDDTLAQGQDGTGNCGDINPAGYSTRCTWATGGVMYLYAYHQRRPGNCGHKFKWNCAPLVKNRWYEYAQRLRVNDVGQANGEITIWVDGNVVLAKTDFEWRGNTSNMNCSDKSKRALVAKVKEMNYFGGNDDSGPRWDCNWECNNVLITDVPPAHLQE